MPSSTTKDREKDDIVEETAQLVSLSIEGPSNGSKINIEEAHLIRKMHFRVLPYCAIVVILAYIDRGNLGFAANQVCHDLNLTHTEYGTGASLFFIGYVVAHLPSVVFYRKFGVPRCLAFIMLSWGLIASASAFVQSTWQFYVLRLLLGVVEAGVFPGVWYYLTVFYPDQYLTFPYAILEAAVAMASPVSAPIAAGILSLDGVAGARGWRVLFFFEGVLPVLIAPMLFFCMPRTPSQAKFLTREEVRWIQQEQGGPTMNKQTNTLLMDFQILASKWTYWILLLAAVMRSLLLTVALYWTTLIIDHMITPDAEIDKATCAASHSGGVKAVALTAVPYTISCTFTIVIGILSEKMYNRTNITALLTAMSGFCLILWGFVEKFGFIFGLLALSLSITGVNAPLPLLLGLIVSHFEPSTKSTAVTVANMIGSLGALIGPVLTGFLVDHYHHDYAMPLLILGCMGVSGSFLIFMVKDPLLVKMMNSV